MTIKTKLWYAKLSCNAEARRTDLRYGGNGAVNHSDGVIIEITSFTITAREMNDRNTK